MAVWRIGALAPDTGSAGALGVHGDFIFPAAGAAARSLSSPRGDPPGSCSRLASPRLASGQAGQGVGIRAESLAHTWAQGGGSGGSADIK